MAELKKESKDKSGNKSKTDKKGAKGKGKKDGKMQPMKADAKGGGDPMGAKMKLKAMKMPF